MTWRDHVTILDADNHPIQVVLGAHAKETDERFEIVDPATGKLRAVLRKDLVNPAESKNTFVAVTTPAGERQARVLALDLSDDFKRVQRLLVEDPATGKGMWTPPPAGYALHVPQPRIQIGVATLILLANPTLLWASVLIFPIVYFITSHRWHELLGALDIHLGHARTFVLNMVGAFYNTFMPGSTGGDVLRAYYASKQTPHRARAIISVLVDRVIGLYALIILGGTMAAWQYLASPSSHDPAVRACRRVALGSALILFVTLVGIAILASPKKRRKLGIDYLLKRLPLQKHVQHALQVLRIYKKRPGLMLWALVMTFPVHITVVISAALAGKAFNIPLPFFYYFVAVPVIVLAGAIPISPQGAGVMEFFAIQLTKQHGVTVSQAFALTMSIRMVQILWNLVGGIFVFRGGYHAPTQVEQAEMETDDDDTAEPLPGAVVR